MTSQSSTPATDKKKLQSQIAAVQKAADFARKEAKLAKLNFRTAKQKFKDARRAARKLRKEVKALEAELSARTTKKKPAGPPPAAKARAPVKAKTPAKAKAPAPKAVIKRVHLIAGPATSTAPFGTPAAAIPSATPTSSVDLTPPAAPAP